MRPAPRHYWVPVITGVCFFIAAFFWGALFWMNHTFGPLSLYRVLFYARHPLKGVSPAFVAQALFFAVFLPLLAAVAVGVAVHPRGGVFFRRAFRNIFRLCGKKVFHSRWRLAAAGTALLLVIPWPRPAAGRNLLPGLPPRNAPLPCLMACRDGTPGTLPLTLVPWRESDGGIATIPAHQRPHEKISGTAILECRDFAAYTAARRQGLRNVALNLSRWGYEHHPEILRQAVAMVIIGDGFLTDYPEIVRLWRRRGVTVIIMVSDDGTEEWLRQTAAKDRRYPPFASIHYCRRPADKPKPAAASGARP